MGYPYSRHSRYALLLHTAFLVKWKTVIALRLAPRRQHRFSPINTTAMQINISTRKGDISDATKEKITQKIEKLQRFFDRLTAVDVTVNLEKADEPSIEVVVRSERRDDFVASYQSDNMFGSIDQILSKLEQQIKKHKEKLQDRGKNVSATEDDV